MTVEAKIIEDSISPTRARITTFQLRYPRMIHAEFMTHRLFCLSGDSILEFDLPSGQNNQRKRIFTMTLKEFAHKWYDGDSLGRNMQHRLRTMHIRQLDELTNKVSTSTVTDCYISGHKEVFSIQAGKYAVAGSKDHRILTIDGWKTIENLTPGKDFIITRQFGKLDEDVLDPIRLKKINHQWKSTFLNRIRQSKLQEQNFQCFDCSCDVTDNDHELHHDTPVYKDPSRAFDITNIVVLCIQCHKERHRIQDWQGGTYLYGNPVLLDEIVSLGVQATYDLSIAGQYENFIANGVIVHNSRNASSSRAVPVRRILAAIQDDPVIPIHWGKNQKGMQAGEEVDPLTAQICETVWLEACRAMLEKAKVLSDMGIHKQVVNRLLEPWSHISVVVTATEYDNFFSLRCHPDAAPTMRLLAETMRDLYFTNTPRRLSIGEWHLPYIKDEEKLAPGNYTNRGVLKNEYDLIRASTARCARVSFLTHDKKTPSIENDIELYGRLFNSKHMSAFEHLATPLANPHEQSGNFKGWCQYRKMLKGECCHNYRLPSIKDVEAVLKQEENNG